MNVWMNDGNSALTCDNECSDDVLSRHSIDVIVEFNFLIEPTLDSQQKRHGDMYSVLWFLWLKLLRPLLFMVKIAFLCSSIFMLTREIYIASLSISLFVRIYFRFFFLLFFLRVVGKSWSQNYYVSDDLIRILMSERTGRTTVSWNVPNTVSGLWLYFSAPSLETSLEIFIAMTTRRPVRRTRQALDGMRVGIKTRPSRPPMLPNGIGKA